MKSAPTVDLLGPLNPTEQRHMPSKLWTRGDTALLERHPRVAIVGTRRPSDEGARRTRRLVSELVTVNAVIVSGLAEGVDTIAHTEVLTLGARTIAVIGTPIDEVFPKQNAALQKKLGESELLVSEFAPDTTTSKGNFPRRNRRWRSSPTPRSSRSWSVQRHDLSWVGGDPAGASTLPPQVAGRCRAAVAEGDGRARRLRPREHGRPAQHPPHGRDP